MPREENLNIENQSAKIQLKGKAQLALKTNMCFNVARRVNEVDGQTAVQESLWHMVRSFIFLKKQCIEKMQTTVIEQ